MARIRNITSSKTFVHCVLSDALKRARFKGVRFTSMISRTIHLFFFCVLTSSCSNKQYPDLSHYSLYDYGNEDDCDNNRQCKAIGYGVGGSCGPTYEGGVAGFITYSTKIGSKNVRRLKALAAESRRDSTYDVYKRNIFQMNEVALEECLPIHYNIPNPKCINNKCSHW